MSKLSIKPLSDRVVIEPSPAEEKTAGGIIIAESAKEKPQRGTVVAAGPGKTDEPVTVKVGDTVLYGKYAGTEISILSIGNLFWIASNSNLVGITRLWVSYLIIRENSLISQIFNHEGLYPSKLLSQSSLPLIQGQVIRFTVVGDFLFLFFPFVGGFFWLCFGADGHFSNWLDINSLFCNTEIKIGNCFFNLADWDKNIRGFYETRINPRIRQGQ
jgi:chaperonin GroES